MYVFDRYHHHHHHSAILSDCRLQSSINVSVFQQLSFLFSVAPRIISNEQKKAVEIGSAVTFACDTIGNPTPHIEWTKAGYPNRILSTSSKYAFLPLLSYV
jgi:hypothetical protein